MTADQMPPLHQIDAYHAQVQNQIRLWVDHVYPTVTEENTDRTRQWFAASANLYNQVDALGMDRDEAVGMLAQLAADLLLAHARRVTTVTEPGVEYAPPDPGRD